jgi:DNA polymerase-3 subunit alpha
MKVLVYDTETTGLPKVKDLNIDSLFTWPYIIQFSYVIYDIKESKLIKIKDNIVKIDSNIEISNDSIKIHGITKEKSKNEGVNLKLLIDEFMEDFEKVDYIVGHNLVFDLNMIKAEIMRKIYFELEYF